MTPPVSHLPSRVAALVAAALLATPLAAQSVASMPAVVPVDLRLVPGPDPLPALVPAPLPRSLVAVTTRPLAGESVPAAASRGRRPLFSSQDLTYWGAAAAAGLALYQLDDDIAGAVPDTIIPDEGGWDYAAERISSFNEYAAAYVAVGLWGSGRLFGKRNVAHMGAHAMQAAVLGKIGMDLGRGLAGRARPITQRREERGFDASDFEFNRGWSEVGYGAFPSRHVTGVSAVSSTIAFETMHHFPQHARWVTPLAIAVPIAVGMGRTYTNHHWATDVLAGGALGTWLGWKTVRFNHNHPNNWLDRILLGRR